MRKFSKIEKVILGYSVVAGTVSSILCKLQGGVGFDRPQNYPYDWIIFNLSLPFGEIFPHMPEVIFKLLFSSGSVVFVMCIFPAIMNFILFFILLQVVYWIRQLLSKQMR